METVGIEELLKKLKSTELLLIFELLLRLWELMEPV
jgi:hypothetical protein